MSNHQKGQGKAAENKIAPVGNVLFYNSDPSLPGVVVGGLKSGAEDFVCLSEFGKDGPTVIEVLDFFFFFLLLLLLLLFLLLLLVLFSMNFAPIIS